MTARKPNSKRKHWMGRGFLPPVPRFRIEERDDAAERWVVLEGDKTIAARFAMKSDAAEFIRWKNGDRDRDEDAA